MTGLLVGLIVAASVAELPAGRSVPQVGDALSGVVRAQAGPAAQGRGPRAGGPPAGRRGGGTPAPPPTSAEAEALFERFVVRQARMALRLTPAEMQVVEPRLRQLQATRRRVQRERTRLLNELAATTRGSSPVDEAVVQERLRAMDAFRIEAESQVREAMARLDEVLTVEQRARFRVFERRIERQKLELLAQARREAEAARTPQGSSETSPP